MSASTAKREDPSPQLCLRLYVAGNGPNSARAIANLRAALVAVSLPADDVEIVDVLQAPERGLRDGVLVTPMLVRVSPLPERRILGNLSDGAILHGVLSCEGTPLE